ncbi:MAG: MazG nucleotide pyrophosphohydrolase domain-containing protein [Parachlamydiaceae bacterium]
METLLNIIDRLMGPGGCPWDQNQTLAGLREDLLEESCEVIDAVDTYEAAEITEELGDLLFIALFMTRVAEKEGKGSLQEILEGICSKVIRRHPHIFEEAKTLTEKEVLEQWDLLKEKEKGKQDPFARIPKALPALSRGVEVIKVLEKQGASTPNASSEDPEEQLGWELFSLVQEAHKNKLNPEQALRQVLAKLAK